MLNGIFVGIVLLSILMAAFSGRMEMLSQAVLESAGRQSPSPWVSLE